MPATICLRIPAMPDPHAAHPPGRPEHRTRRSPAGRQPALTPLMPIFNIIDAVVAAFECIKAIPQTIGPPPDPTALATAIPERAQKVSRLLGLVPQLSLPLTIVGLIDLLIDTLSTTRDQLEHLQQHLESVAAASARAVELDDPGLLDIALCPEANVAQEGANIGKALGLWSQARI